MHIIFSYASLKNVSLLEIFNALKIKDLIAAVLWLVAEKEDMCHFVFNSPSALFNSTSRKKCFAVVILFKSNFYVISNH